MGYFGALTVICTVPFFIVQKRRPGQQLPAGTKWWLAGPQLVESFLLHPTFPPCCATERYVFAPSSTPLPPLALLFLSLIAAQTSMECCQECSSPQTLHALPRRLLYAEREWVVALDILPRDLSNDRAAFGTYFSVTGILQNEWVVRVLRAAWLTRT
jgi:hypothetical protein